ncbi:hypothetical protein LEP1GSC203_3561 [Leptospira terpstrae serovar Hualin str. LT 11-33 = ATCC 700639]|uniref:Uncharacterized protein n=1 Tax=Leptospira terpstrae serovar Hualin str. LT 11-33 = ATCC 700639 TaxID=1257025 RepID=N1VS08_9LEPT|nr:hypothetical protein LEP1GSC203_3561 [Leptospira terpstrae serovar Hualin str. LT 11-33 = ATCC 700639]
MGFATAKNPGNKTKQKTIETFVNEIKVDRSHLVFLRKQDFFCGKTVFER